MAAKLWAKLTQTDGKPIWVNIDNAVSMDRIIINSGSGETATRIFFPAMAAFAYAGQAVDQVATQYVDVREHPDKIFADLN